MSLNLVTREELEQVIFRTRDYVNGTGAKGVVVAMSGGADSALTAAVLAHAIGSDRILGIGIPIESSPHALVDAYKITGWLGIRMLNLPLNETLASFMDESGLLDDSSFIHANPKKKAMIKGNVKARLRTTLARAWAEVHGYLFVNTCNWSETIVGYDTKGGGDADGDFSILMQFVKEDVWHMLEMLDAPEWIINKIPSADLEEGQTDEGDLRMSYQVLDRFARVMATDGREGVMAMNDHDNKRERFFELVDGSRHKRAPMPVFERKGFNYQEK